MAMAIKRFTILFVALIACAVTFAAYAESDGSTFTISSKVELPVTVKPNGKSSFKIYQPTYTTSQRIADATITDAHGNKCMTRHSTAHVGGNVHHYWEITGVYSTSPSSGSSYSESYSGGGSGGSSSDFAQSLASTWVSGSFLPVDGYPCIALGVGMSRFAGEFARIKWSIGGFTSLVLQGSVGKDFIFNLPNKDKLAWNVGAGLRIGEDHHDVNINLLFGETPLCENYGLLMNAEYEYYFGDAKRFGIFGGLGVVLGDTKKKDPDSFFDFHVGIAVKLWQK